MQGFVFLTLCFPITQLSLKVFLGYIYIFFNKIYIFLCSQIQVRIWREHRRDENTWNYYTGLREGKKDKKIGLSINLMKCKAWIKALRYWPAWNDSKQALWHWPVLVLSYWPEITRKDRLMALWKLQSLQTYYTMGPVISPFKNITYIEN